MIIYIYEYIIYIYNIYMYILHKKTYVLAFPLSFIHIYNICIIICFADHVHYIIKPYEDQ